MIFAKSNSKIIAALIIFGFTACNGCSKVGMEDKDLQILNKIQEFNIKSEFANKAMVQCAMQIDPYVQHMPKYDETDPRNYRMNHYYNASQNVTSLHADRPFDGSNLESNFFKFYVGKKEQERQSGKDLTWDRKKFMDDYNLKSKNETRSQVNSFFNAPPNTTPIMLSHASYLSNDERNTKCDSLAQSIGKGDFYLSNANDSDLSEAIARVGIQ